MASFIVGEQVVFFGILFRLHLILSWPLWRDLFVMTYEIIYSEWRDQYYDSALLLLTMSIKKRQQLQRESLFCFNK